MQFSKLLLLVLVGGFLYPTVSVGGNDLVPVERSKEGGVHKTKSHSGFPKFEIDPFMQSCLEKCKRNNQMLSMGIEAIMESCQHKCNIEKARSMSKSTDPVEKKEGTLMLCESADKSIVPDLIALLQEDLVKRTGIWADIIPALGRTRDDRAIPILTKLINLLDDDWLGREMAVRAIGEIGNPSTTKVLINAAWRGDTRDEAIIALAKMGDEQAAPVLISALQKEEEQTIQKTAADGLIRIGGDAVPAIQKEYINYAKEYPNTHTRVKLCEILGKIHNVKAQSILQSSYNDPDTAVRVCARKYTSR